MATTNAWRIVLSRIPQRENRTALHNFQSLLWIGEQRRPLRRDRRSDTIMDSCMNYYSDEAPALQYEPGALFLDNGAFSASMGGFDLSPNRVMSIQEALMPSFTIPLDYPF